MPKFKIEDPQALAHMITSLGGSVLHDRPTLQFTLPLSEVEQVIPKLNEFGVGCRRVGEYVGDHPTKLFSPQSVVVVECIKRPEAKEPNELREAWFK